MTPPTRTSQGNSPGHDPVTVMRLELEAAREVASQLRELLSDLGGQVSGSGRAQ